MDHLLISCGNCHDQLRSTPLGEPPHEIVHRQAGAKREDNEGLAGGRRDWGDLGRGFGSWRYALPGLREAVHKEVAAALAAGKSAVTGGALGTDYWATEVALSIDPAG